MSMVTEATNIFRYDQDILPYIESQWVMFQPPESLSSLTLWQREDRILDVLLKHKDRFGMLRHKRLENSVWWLNIVAPPPGPRFRVTTDKILTGEVKIFCRKWNWARRHGLLIRIVALGCA